MPFTYGLLRDSPKFKTMNLYDNLVRLRLKTNTTPGKIPEVVSLSV